MSNKPRPHYLEIVTPDVDGVCELYRLTAGLVFSAGDEHLGGARVAVMASETRIGVRAPMRDDEGPLSRIYLLVDDLAAAVQQARDANAQIALEGMSLGGGHGDIAIVIQGGIEHGFWQLPLC